MSKPQGEPDCRAVWRRLDARRRGDERLGVLPPQDDPMRAFLLVEIEPLAVVAAHALGDQDLRAADRVPLARLLADLARLALGPALDPKHRQVRQQSERRTDRT